MTRDTVKRRERRTTLFARQGGRCFWCDKRMELIEKPAPDLIQHDLCTLDHLLSRRDPRRQQHPGGEQRLVAACQQCNWQRGFVQGTASRQAVGVNA